jgi:hypothetical protein
MKIKYPVWPHELPRRGEIFRAEFENIGHPISYRIGTFTNPIFAGDCLGLPHVVLATADGMWTHFYVFPEDNLTEEEKHLQAQAVLDLVRIGEER